MEAQEKVGVFSPAATKEKRAFGWRDIFGYFMGDFGCNMSFTLVSSYLFVFFTQYIGIKPAHYALIILLTKILDGIDDPLIGAMVDRKGVNKKGEKFKPWILIGAPILAIAASIMFFDTTAWTYSARVIFAVVGYIAWDLAYTVVNVPYGALSSVMTTKSEQRTQLSTARSYGAIIAGTPLGILIPMFIYQNMSENGKTTSVFLGNRMFPLALILGVVAFFSFLLLYANTEERVKVAQVADDAPVEKFSYIETVKGFLHNRPILALTLAALASTIFIWGGESLHQLTYQLYFNNGKIYSMQTLLYFIPMIVGTLFGTPLVKKFGKMSVTAWPLLIPMAIYGIMAFLPISSPYVWVGLQAFGSIFTFGMTLFTWALVADAIDYQEWKTGKRNEGSVYATYSMMRKIGQGVGSAAVPAIIAIAIPGLVLTDSATWIPEYAAQIKTLSALFPFVGYLITFICFKVIWNLKDNEITQMQIDLGRDE